MVLLPLPSSSIPLSTAFHCFACIRSGKRWTSARKNGEGERETQRLAGERQRVPGSISISDYFTSTESTPAWTMHSSTLFFVLSCTAPFPSAGLVLSAPLRPRSTSALCREEHLVAKHGALPRPSWREPAPGGVKRKKQRECTHLKRTAVSGVRCIGNAKVYKPAAESASHVPWTPSTLDLPISREPFSRRLKWNFN